MTDPPHLSDLSDQSFVATRPIPPRTGLSKSRIAIFEQCVKRLWLSVHMPELTLESDGTRRVFRIGHEVGAAACALYPDGIEIDGTAGMGAAAKATAGALVRDIRVPLFEATFIHAGVAVRVDLMIPDGDGWQIAEVKSTTSVKPYQRADLATQLWVLDGCCVNVTRASVRVIDRAFVLRTEGDYRGLFIDEPAGEGLAPLIAARGDVVASAVATLAGCEPAIQPGAQCSEPFVCSFVGYCNRDLPPAPAWPVTLLPGMAGKTLARAIAKDGIDNLLLVDAERLTQPLLARVHAATVSGVPYHDAEAIRCETDGWAYPRTFLDFETIAFAVPRWVGTSPYQQIPFQFSAHVDHGEGDLEHTEFLSTDGADPRAACAAALASLPMTGAVVAWNAPFERSCLLQLASAVPGHATALRALAGHLVDLLPVSRQHYYHRDMRGSWSIKAVLPTLAPELNYNQLDGARSGVEAQDAYLEAIDAATSPERRELLRHGLLDYCRLDTMAMVVALKRLRA
ncbi:hypothetical protein GCM10008023_06720 [Sphingomonas glacialis]|uniref:DUF2779 domain-containing protein n=1 Tax=Sphingomonas glacialis TaxID=658225 RepID=A0ABQ3LAU7_9SPHN|nr:DUF2779 domain-containing protein [Sphingomonas glacialis]GHH09706.1 hypothetical protein GCM10008023_06720 [Sphingomonas glacialis]